MSDIDLAAADHLLTTTKQVRKRLDLTRPVPRELLLECIDIASHAPMGGNRERNRWMVVDDPDLKAGHRRAVRRRSAGRTSPPTRAWTPTRASSAWSTRRPTWSTTSPRCRRW